MYSGKTLEVDKKVRAAHLQQKPCCLWLTGLPASGKSTIANLLERRLFGPGGHTYLLDGDNVRHGLCRDLGFTKRDRIENNRRAAEVAKLFIDAGLLVIVSFISPYQVERDRARSLFEEDKFLEIFIDAPPAVCERRDPKGLYRKARNGEMTNMTGVHTPYEVPQHPDCHLRTAETSPEECVDMVLARLEKLEALPRRLTRT